MVQSKVDLKHNNRNVGLMKGITYNCHGQGVKSHGRRSNKYYLFILGGQSMKKKLVSLLLATTMVVVLAPSQTISKGAKADFGRLFRTTM